MNTLAYIRVSTDEQDASGHGQDAQASDVDAYVERKGWTLTETYQDVASGKTLAKRPGLKAALERLEDKSLNGSRPQALVVAKLDRLSRSMLDFASMIERSQRNDWLLVVVEPEIDLTTPYGRAMANVIMTFAQLEREMISDRTKAAMAEMKAQGIRLGRPLARDGKDEMAKARIEAALPVLSHLTATGASLRKIAAELNARGLVGPQGGQWHGRSVQLTLRRYGIERGAGTV
jgi:DNA invertase Pin-like site-specific DNA recombinase